MKKSKFNVIQIICCIYVVLTGGLNLYSYFHLPSTIATQFSFSGGNVNHMSTPVYLIGGFILILVLSMFSIKSQGEQRIKYILVTTIVVVANSAMIFTQL